MVNNKKKGIVPDHVKMLHRNDVTSRRNASATTDNPLLCAEFN